MAGEVIPSADTLQVRYIESVDLMVQQLIKRLCAAEKATGKRFMICITGDHSTPVLTGDHSHEPVPFALAHIQHVVSLELHWTACERYIGLTAAPGC